MAVFELGSLICGVSTSSTMFIIGRAIAGSGASGILNGGMTIVHSSVAQRKRQCNYPMPYCGTTEVIRLQRISRHHCFRNGFRGNRTSLGSSAWRCLDTICHLEMESAMHPLTFYFRPLTDIAGFYINLPLGGATALLILVTRIPEQRLKKRSPSLEATVLQLDPVGFVLFAPSVIMLLLALNWGASEYSWASATIIGLLCGSFCCSCIFLLWEWRQGDSAMVPLGLLKNRIISACYLTGLVQAGAIVGTTYFLPIWFQAIRGDTPTMSGVDIMPTVGSQIFLAAITGFFGETIALAFCRKIPS